MQNIKGDNKDFIRADGSMLFSQNLEKALHSSFQMALERRHSFITPEHLSLALLEQESVSDIFNMHDMDLLACQEEFKNFLGHNTYPVTGNNHIIQTNEAVQRIIRWAIINAAQSGNLQIGCYDVLLGILSERETNACHFFKKYGMTSVEVRSYIDTCKSSKKDAGDEECIVLSSPRVEKNVLEVCCVDLNQQIEDGDIVPSLIGREEELASLECVLCRRFKSNAIFVGDPGVGKNAIVERFAQKIIEGNCAKQLRDKRILMLDMASLVAGTRYRGDFEERLQDLMANLEKDENAILFIDDIHNVMGTGSGTGQGMDTANLLKPALSRQTCQFIGATTYDEYNAILERDTAFIRRFQKIDVKEPNAEEAAVILKSVSKLLSQFHNVSYSQGSIYRAVSMSQKYLHGRCLPDKAIEILDDAGAHAQLECADSQLIALDEDDIDKSVEKIARISVRSFENKKDAISLPNTLKRSVFGQDHAIDELMNVIQLSQTGLQDHDRCRSAHLFYGQPGVGKTALALSLAKTLNIPLIRIDMSEYMEKHQVSSLIGAPPGYVGFEVSGRLTDQLRKNPQCVLLLDEIEKAHTDVLHLLLQLIDAGEMKDSKSRTINGRGAFIIMTSNLGTSEQMIGFAQDTKSAALRAIKKHFRPEFLNRLDGIIGFNVLNDSVKRKIIDKVFKELCEQLRSKNIELVVDGPVKEWVKVNCMENKKGARALLRFFREKIKQPIAHLLLSLDHDPLALHLRMGDATPQVHLYHAPDVCNVAADAELSGSYEKTISNIQHVEAPAEKSRKPSPEFLNALPD